MRRENEYSSFLSANMQQIAGVIGIENTLLIMKRYGGQTLKMVTGRRESFTKKELTALIGDCHTRMLTREFAGEEIYISIFTALESKIRRYKRDKEINRQLDTLTRGGLSYRQATKVLADEFNITDRQIYKIISRG